MDETDGVTNERLCCGESLFYCEREAYHVVPSLTYLPYLQSCLTPEEEVGANHLGNNDAATRNSHYYN